MGVFLNRVYKVALRKLHSSYWATDCQCLRDPWSRPNCCLLFSWIYIVSDSFPGQKRLILTLTRAEW